MATRSTTKDDTQPRTFLDRAGIELQRAERYRVFVSMSVLDMAPVKRLVGDIQPAFAQEILTLAKHDVRACDYVSLIDGHLALLFPETSRQEAEIPARRIAEMIRSFVHEKTGIASQDVIPVEIASYPDTAGARTMSAFLEDLTDKSRN
jgi:hypothetical protein